MLQEQNEDIIREKNKFYFKKSSTDETKHDDFW